MRRDRGAAGPRQRGECRAQPVPGPVRTGAGRARDQGRGSRPYGGLGAGDRRGRRARRELARLRARGAAGLAGGAPGGARRSDAAAPRRRGRPVVPRRLPRARRLHRPAPGLRAGSRRGHPRGHRLGPGRARRRRLPHRPQVAGHGLPARPSALPRLQRRRIGAGHLQGPGPHGGRPVRARRGDDDRRVRDRRPPGLPLPARRVPARPAPAGARDRAGPCARTARRRRPRAGLRLRHRDPARRGRLHLR